MATSPRNAVVTGAAHGLGRAIAIRLASDGCNVVVNDLPAKQDLLDGLVKEIEASGHKASSFACDAAVEDSVKSLVAHCVSVYGSLDVVRALSHFLPIID